MTDPDFDRFLGYALGSLNELEYDRLLAHDRCFLQSDEHSQICEQLVEVRRMLSGLKSQLKA